MSGEEDHSSNIFGTNYGLPRSDLTLSQHIENYSLTTLTYQSDVLKALNGLFASFSRDHCPVRQLWGIPTVEAAFTSYLVRSIPDDPDIEQGFRRVFGFSLTWGTLKNSLWRTTYSGLIHQRDGHTTLPVHLEWK